MLVTSILSYSFNVLKGFFTGCAGCRADLGQNFLKLGIFLLRKQESIQRQKYWQLLLTDIFIFLSFRDLTLNHTIPTFNNPEKEASWKCYGKKRKYW